MVSEYVVIGGAQVLSILNTERWERLGWLKSCDHDYVTNLYSKVYKANYSMRKIMISSISHYVTFAICPDSVDMHILADYREKSLPWNVCVL